MYGRRNCLSCEGAGGEVPDGGNANILVHYARFTSFELTPEVRLAHAIISTDEAGGHHLLPRYQDGRLSCVGSPRMMQYVYPHAAREIILYDADEAAEVHKAFELLAYDPFKVRRRLPSERCKICGRTVAPWQDATRVHGYVGTGTFDGLLRDGESSRHIQPFARDGVTVCRGDEALYRMLTGQLEFPTGIMNRLMGGADAFRQAYALLVASYGSHVSTT